VLLVEDTPANVIIATSFLKRLGHSWRHAANGHQALDLLAQEHFDVVLMDVEMPGMDGLAATRFLRAGQAGEANREAPVLAMTAHALGSFREQCEKAGMNGFLTKPVSFATLSAALAEIQPRPREVQKAAAQQTAAPDSPDSSATQGQPSAQNSPSLPGTSAASAAQAGLNRRWPVDLEHAVQMLGGQTGLLAEIIEIFLADLPGKRSALAQALREENVPGLRLIAHSLRSTCGNVGAFAAGEAAALLERRAAGGFSGCVQVVEDLDALLEHSARVLRAAKLPGQA
jgi:CheY-like chemotaxis protein